MEADPEVDSDPDQAPLAVQLVALLEVQVSVLAEPRATVVGFALKVTVGAVAVTVTVADCIEVPPVPVQLNV